MREFSEVTTISGERVYAYEYVQSLRDADKKKPDPRKIIAQKGAQERMLSADADILIGGGNRGGSKTFSLLLEGLRNVYDKNYNAILFRKEKPDLVTIVDTAEEVYGQYGIYNRSDNDKTWYFYAGGKLKFNYYNDEYSDFKDRFQGHQYSYIGVDEITQMPYDKFKYLLTCNRNAYGLRNRFFGTCNPDPDSWVRIFLSWWIDPDTGLPIPERDGVVRYCFMDGDDPNTIIWGDTRQEVYEQCKEIIDKLWKPAYDELGYKKEEVFVKSVAFVKAGLEENLKLLTSDPTYLANLAGQSEEQRMRDLEGNWNFKNAGNDLIKTTHLENAYKNAQQTENMKRYATCDVAFTGGDNLVLWLWVGHHVKDMLVLRCDSKTAIYAVKNKLREWGVSEDCFAYDLNGIGQAFRGFFKDAVPFNNLAAPIPETSAEKESIKAMYANLKSQCAYLLVQDFRNGNISFEPDLLDRKFSGDGFEKMPLRNILQKERKCIRQSEDAADKGFALIPKKLMKKYVGHSPDFFESLLFRKIFDIRKKHTKPRGLWMVS